MPDINELYPSKWIKAEDLKGRQVTVTIDNVTMETIGDDVKPVVYFRGRDKGLVCNKTNALTIADIVGSPNTEKWHGHRIVLYSMKVNFQGKITDAVRCMAAAEVPKRQEPPAEIVGDEADDQVPF